MTSPVSAVEAIEKVPYRIQGMVRSIDQYRNGDPKAVADGSYAQVLFALQDMRHDILVLWDFSVEAARQAEALQRRAEAAEALVERMRQEAQSHAMDARTANSTIHEIYQVVSGGKGEPGNWHGAEPVRAKLEALKRENAELREGLKPFADAAQLYDPPEGDDGDVAWAHDFTIGSLRRARTLLKEEANAGN